MPNDSQHPFELRRDPQLLLRSDCQVACQVQIFHFLNTLRILSQRMNIPKHLQKMEHKEPALLHQCHIISCVSKGAEGHRGQKSKAASLKTCGQDMCT